jgi:CRISPR-associated protein Cmr2
MKRELAELKIEAMLHDPPGKAPTLWYCRHEDFSAQLVRTILARPPRHDDLVRRADRYASACDRAVLPKTPREYRTDFLRDPQIVHPLSGSRYHLGSLREEDPERIEVIQREAVERLVREAGGPGADPERLYWTLWRGLEAALVEDSPVGKLWRYLPADTRVPDHSIWDHMRLAAAFVGALPEPALLVFSVGPVQALIQEARRTADLWSGSFLLSWLAWRAMRELVEEQGPDVVLFPDLHGQPLADRWLQKERGWRIGEGAELSDGSSSRRDRGRVASLPNRFLALIPRGEGERLARGCEAAVKSAAREFTEQCLRDLPESGRRDRIAEAAGQMMSALHCQWYLLPWEADEMVLKARSTALLGSRIAAFWTTRALLSDRELYRPNLGTFFAAHSGLVELGHGAAKATRRFEQVDERGARCTVCATRAWLWAADGPGEGPLNRALKLKPRERLCGLCAARRRAPTSEWAANQIGAPMLFPSTHNLAANRFSEDVLRALGRLGGPGARSIDYELAAALEAFVDTVEPHLDRQAYATRALIQRARRCREQAGLAERFIKFPAELLDRESYAESRIADGELQELVDRAAAREAGRALERLLDVCVNASIPPPRRYYAALVLDGDHMGKWLSGEKAPTIREVLHKGARPAEDAEYLGHRRPLSVAHQVNVSRALNSFSLDIVSHVVEDVHGGVVVYAGGDDALAMLPVESVLPCVRDLRRLYAGLPLQASSRAAREGFRSNQGHVGRGSDLWRVMGERATCSIGVAIAHQKWPLNHTLRTAHEMERYAKDRLNRNAVAIALLKRSGGHEHFAVRWGKADGVHEPDPLSVLEDIAALISDAGSREAGAPASTISRRFVVALGDETPALWPIKDALRDRAYWLIDRHWRKAVAAFRPAEAKGIAQALQALAEQLDDQVGDEARTLFVAGLRLAEFIAREGGGPE